MLEYENQVLEGPCLVVLRELPDEVFDAVVMDPPYGLGKEPTVGQLVAFLKGADLVTGDFMGAKWEIPSVPVWREIYRVLKPGGHVLSFGGTRSWDLISLGARAAGFEFRDTIADVHPALMMVHGMGFPKSLNVSKKIDQLAGAEREVVGSYRVGGNALTPTSEKGGTYVTGAPNSPAGDLEVTAPATDDAKKWEGYGTALKPSWEPILVFRKPLEGTVVENVLEHGTGALNIDGCRVGTETREYALKVPDENLNTLARPGKGDDPDAKGLGAYGVGAKQAQGETVSVSGRWPPNSTLTHAPGCKRVGTKRVETSSNSHTDRKQEISGFQGSSLEGSVSGELDAVQSPGHADEDGLEEVEAWQCVEGCPVRALDEQSGEGVSPLDDRPKTTGTDFGVINDDGWQPKGCTIQGYADSGGASRFFPQFEGQAPPDAPFYYTSKATKKEATLDGQIENKHPTKKPLGVMRWLVKLVCPKDGIVLDPYAGSGTTLHAAALEGMRFTGIERDSKWVETSRARMKIIGQEVAADRGQRDIFSMMGEFDDDD